MPALRTSTLGCTVAHGVQPHLLSAHGLHQGTYILPLPSFLMRSDDCVVFFFISTSFFFFFSFFFSWEGEPAPGCEALVRIRMGTLAVNPIGRLLSKLAQASAGRSTCPWAGRFACQLVDSSVYCSSAGCSTCLRAARVDRRVQLYVRGDRPANPLSTIGCFFFSTSRGAEGYYVSYILPSPAFSYAVMVAFFFFFIYYYFFFFNHFVFPTAAIGFFFIFYLLLMDLDSFPIFFFFCFFGWLTPAPSALAIDFL